MHCSRHWKYNSKQNTCSQRICCGGKTDSKLADLCKRVLSAVRNVNDTKGVPRVGGDLHIYARSRGSLTCGYLNRGHKAVKGLAM